jgi:hypothetical protein
MGSAIIGTFKLNASCGQHEERGTIVLRRKD